MNSRISVAHPLPVRPTRPEAPSRPVLAAGLSLVFPGLGQVYNGQLGKGLFVFLTAFLVLPYIWGVYDAYRTASSSEVASLALGYTAELPPAPTLDVQLLRAAAANGGTLTVSQGVLATSRSFSEVETELDAMLHKGHADIDNDPVTGAILYRFTTLG